MEYEFRKSPKRMQPNVLTTELNAPIVITSERLAIKFNNAVTYGELLNGIIRFIWLPQVAVEFEGLYKGEGPEIGTGESTLLISSFSDEIPIIITSMTLCGCGLKVRGILNGCAVKKTGSNALKLVFHLVNFPDYIGQDIYAESDNVIKAYKGRISLESDQWIGVIDSIPETEQLRKEHKTNAGFYISHVGEIRSKSGEYLDETQINTLCSNLHFLFGFCCGSWPDRFFHRGAVKMRLFGSSLLHGKQDLHRK